jgi:hypothetical protein
MGYIYSGLSHCNLLGGCNHLEKYESMGRIIPYMKLKLKHDWKHQPVIHCIFRYLFIHSDVDIIEYIGYGISIYIMNYPIIYIYMYGL